MTKEQLADILNEGEYREEICKELEARAKQSELVVVFGYSDDNIEFRGAIYDEIGCWIGEENQERTIFFTKDGKFPDIDELTDEGLQQDMSRYQCITAKWSVTDIHKNHVASWVIKSPMPYAEFKIMEEGEAFCIGCVIDLKDF